tara:strand:+ start:36 stop:746 length:711 start_codon:yes stop_codon:yes gene_type:complete
MLGLSLGTTIKSNPSGIFQLSDVSGLQIWLRKASFITFDQHGVSKWEDISGNNNDATQSSNGKKPSYEDGNGDEVIFDGHNDSLNFNTELNLGAFTICLVVNPDESHTLLNESPIGRAGNDQIKMYRGGSSSRIALKANSVQSDINPMTASFPTSQFLLTCIREASGKFKVRINKSEVGNVATDVTDLFDITQIGSGGISTTEFGGSINEVAVFNLELTGVELNNVETNISNRNAI